MTTATATTTGLLDFARQLHTWGAAVTAIRAGTKRPGHKWERWQTGTQTRAELDALPWHSAAAVGVVNGRGDFRIFDIDAVKDDDGRPVAPVPESIVVELLQALGLPSDYQWSYRSGSGAGFGVVIRCMETLPDDWAAAKGVYIGHPKEGRAFGQLELRWATGQTVIDGAHPTGPGYQWRRGERPFVAPAIRTAAQVVDAFTTIADAAIVAQASGRPPTHVSGLLSADAPPAGRQSANGAAAAVNRYAAAALADAIRQVSTAAPGDRNNTLFRQTAALAELVNGHLLTRPEVERAMTAAALAAGLAADETAATIGSAFKSAGNVARTAKPSSGRLSANGHGPAAQGSTAQPAATPTAAPAAMPNGATAPATDRLHLDDTANAERFVTQHGDGVRYDHSTGHWYIWTGTHWRQDDDGAAQRLAKATARALYDDAAFCAQAGLDGAAAELSKWARQSAAESRRNAMLNLAQAERPIALTHDHFNRHDLLLNCANGTLDLATGRLRAHDRGDLLTYCLPAAYDPAAGCPTWDSFIHRITGGDAELTAFLARAVGYTLSGLTAAQCLFFLYGRGANGKSTFIETVMALMGDLGHKARAQILMADERERVPNEIAALAGRRLVVASELADGGRMNEGLVKDLTGGDTMSARFLYGEPFSFKPSFKLWLYGNHKPVITGTDDGIWRRVHLVPFTVHIPPAERDAALPAKLRAELPGILAWAVMGWQDFQRRGLDAPAAVAQATADYRAESDILGQFMDDRCTVAPANTARAGELYGAFKDWATTNSLRALSGVRFDRAMKDRGFVKGKDSRGKYWQGVGLLATPGP